MSPIASYLIGPTLLCADIQFTYWLLWGGSLVLSVTLVILLWTRWGHSRPLHKCAVLSLIVHLIMAFLTMTVRIVNSDAGGGGGGGPPIHVRLIEDGGDHAAIAAVAHDAKSTVVVEASELAAPALLEPTAKVEMPKPAAETEPGVDKREPEPVVAKAPVEAPANAALEKSVVAEVPATEKKTVNSNAAAKADKAPPVDAIAKSSPKAETTAAVEEIAVSPMSPYSLRNTPGRLGLVAGQGGNAETEAAVAAALRWMASAQSRDGRWDAVQFGAGQEENTLGQDRGGAGRGADTGITALSLLAFLGAGHSHVQGEYQENVRRGLDFLLRSQAADGNLFGEATLYAQMYCHSMATFALAEAEAVTRDRRLEAAVTKAVNYSLAAQNTTTGGWRYRPGDIGDTSQLGWQIMALASARRAGIAIPDQTWSRVDRFLRTVQRGTNGGLASYRPDSPMSTSMTAEALYCRLVLEEMNGTNLGDLAAAEATAQLLSGPPSADRFNLYYWYYATLALHHRQNSNDVAKTAWRTWNDAMTSTLTKSQVAHGSEAGSWNSNTMWGGYGGRIYTTAMATMCLEVYYRYAPAPVRSGSWSAARPNSERTVR